MKKLFLLLTIMVSATLFAQKPIFTTATVKGATVYSNSAELIQTTSVNLPKGTSEIVIKNVADYLNENTVQIGAPNSLTVLSVQFTQNYIFFYTYLLDQKVFYALELHHQIQLFLILIA